MLRGFLRDSKILIGLILEFGVLDGIVIAAKITLKKVNKSKDLFRLSPNNLPHPLFLRSGSSDSLTFLEIFLTKEYEIEIPINPLFIVDLGANIGFGSIYFANKYPESAIVCVEPEEGNFRLLEKNIAPYGNIRPVMAGVWSKDVHLKVVDEGFGEWGYRVVECENDEPGSFSAVTIGKIIDESPFEEIDILKIDIEGAERKIFSENYESWLPKVKVLIIELHDYLGFHGASRAVFSAILKYNFSVFIKGESLVFVRDKNF